MNDTPRELIHLQTSVDRLSRVLAQFLDAFAASQLSPANQKGLEKFTGQVFKSLDAAVDSRYKRLQE